MKPKSPPISNRTTQKDPGDLQDTLKPERSWVWTHFKDSTDSSAAIFQVKIKNYMCGSSLKKDHLGSKIKNHEHLLKKHILISQQAITKHLLQFFVQSQEKLKRIFFFQTRLHFFYPRCIDHTQLHFFYGDNSPFH
ncbi:uncharacterized protein VP01_3114g1 [Puccinia sorghi]|uniref:Uncharacterized protein n=1 Tax=Puccinia sorghi TaxID=27349 RepID=A0A0L6V059_9BASI|nr:uncharacterized protein VP01_3114g1 [Puccinia sorghi]